MTKIKIGERAYFEVNKNSLNFVLLSIEPLIKTISLENISEIKFTPKSINKANTGCNYLMAFIFVLVEGYHEPPTSEIDEPTISIHYKNNLVEKISHPLLTKKIYNLLKLELNR